MNYVLRYVFYAIGVVLLAYLGTANPDHVEFSDVVRLIQSPEAWQATAMIALLLAAFDATLGISSLVGVVFTQRQKQGETRKISEEVPSAGSPEP